MLTAVWWLEHVNQPYSEVELWAIAAGLIAGRHMAAETYRQKAVQNRGLATQRVSGG